MKNLECSYSEALKIPTYQRRYFLSKLKEWYEERSESVKNSMVNKDGKKTFSGEALKNKMRNNEIPNN